jgi:hypothetical protein
LIPTTKNEELEYRVWQVEAAIDLHRQKGLSDERLYAILGDGLDLKE